MEESSSLTRACSVCGLEKPFTQEFFAPKPLRSGNGVYFGTICRLCALEKRRRRRDGKRKRRLFEKVEGSKHCSKCAKHKPADTKHFVPAKKSATGLSSWCRECYQEHDRATYKRKRALLPEAQEGYKYCVVCRIEKSLSADNFSLSKDYSDGFKNTCKKCLASRATDRYRCNPEKFRQRAREYSKNNLDKRRATNSRRRAIKLNAAGSHTADDVKRKFESQRGLCYWCGKKLETSGKNKFQADHLIALSRGGTDGPENIVCACPTCNYSKHNKLPHEWTNRLL